MAKAKKNEPEMEEIDAGNAYLSWETWEFPPQERTRFWYLAASVVGVALILYAIFTANYLFAVIVLMMGVILLVGSLHHPKRITVHITNLGVVVGEDFYPYQDIKDFSIVYNPPEIKILYVDFNSFWKPLVAIPLEDANPNELREYLLQYVFENLDREDETLTDMVRRVYKL